MKKKSISDALLGFVMEILYAAAIILAALLICAAASLIKL
jgi:hypothetical protein